MLENKADDICDEEGPYESRMLGIRRSRKLLAEMERRIKGTRT